jgi:HEAT repeat protein
MKGAPKSDLVRQTLALNERLLAIYLKDLASENPKTRRKAARGLANLGAAAAEAIPALTAALSDRDRRVREAAAWALERLGGDGRDDQGSGAAQAG